MSRHHIASGVLATVAAVAALYIVLSAALAAAMLQPPPRFGQIMRHAPLAIVWGVLPAKPIWMWARRGSIAVGDRAPDFTLPTQDGRTEVTLSSWRGQRPVVLVFGSYT